MSRKIIIMITGIISMILISGQVYAGAKYDRPKFKISAGFGWGAH